MELEIEAQNIDLHPRWKDLVEKKAKKLERFSKKITQLRITLIHSRHHLLGNEQVRLWASLPNHTIRIEKTAPQISDAIRAAFVAAEKEVKALREKKGALLKNAGPRSSHRKRHLFNSDPGRTGQSVGSSVLCWIGVNPDPTKNSGLNVAFVAYGEREHARSAVVNPHQW